MTKLDKLPKTSPDMYSLIVAIDRGKHRIEDKSFVSFRTKEREIDDEQKAAVGECMRQY